MSSSAASLFLFSPPPKRYYFLLLSTDIFCMTIKNAFTVDVEDYFQVSAFEKCVSRNDWDSYSCRVVSNTPCRSLCIFARCLICRIQLKYNRNEYC